jgi:predicted DsbA family dithiol-disulfide isomerase
MIIDIFQDTVCPWCRIGKKHLFTAMQLWDGEPITLRYRTFFLDSTIPKEGLPFRKWMEDMKGGPQVVDQMLNHVTAVGEAAGTTFRFDRVSFRPNTTDSHRLIKLAPVEQSSEMVEAIYKAYFEEGLNIGDLDVLVSIGEQQGMNGGELREQILAGAKQQEIEADLAYARELQISGVPFFVVDGKLALSGAHPAENFLKAFRQASVDG